MLLRNAATQSRIPLMTPEQLKQFREKYNLSQEQLADKLKVARNTVSRWEIGKIEIPEIVDLALQTVERELSKSNN
jgi:DNA-binding transcriptional regulator YiaG